MTKDKNTRIKWLESKGFKTEKEYRNSIAISKGFKNDYERHKIHRNNFFRERGFENEYQYRSNLAKQKGFENRSDEVAKNLGYESYNDYNRMSAWKRGENKPYWLNKDCSMWIGVYIAERILPELFENPEMMPHGNPGYDAICKKGYKIDVKGVCLDKVNRWSFHINHNIIADYFICFGFDNRENLNCLYSWLIKGDEIIRGKKLNESVYLSISNVNMSLKQFKSYELIDKMDKIKEICKRFKEEQLNKTYEQKFNGER